ncbi:hypothetical protein PtB15_3B146 [Puccinia triticina]|nr:hypothetical protein PtB15_3B146 [Puccinia triticina]
MPRPPVWQPTEASGPTARARRPLGDLMTLAIDLSIVTSHLGYPPAGPRPLSIRATRTYTGAKFPRNPNHRNSPDFAADEFDTILDRPSARHAKQRHMSPMLADLNTANCRYPTNDELNNIQMGLMA